MKECGLCGELKHHSVSYKVRGDDGVLRSFPALECASCGRTQPDDEAIDWSEEVPHRLRERCEEVRSEARMKIAARTTTE
jgi:hypothetical protein